VTRGARIALAAAAVFAAAIALLAIAVFAVLRSEWFGDMARRQIVNRIETATGARVEIAALAFDWKAFRVEVDGFTMHGEEGPGAAPLLRTKVIAARLKPASMMRRKVEIESIDIQEPQINLVVEADGRTNIPFPKVKGGGGENWIHRALDLAVGRFTIENGTVHVASRTAALNAWGENLRAQLVYELSGPSYRGTISVNPVHVRWDGRPAMTLGLNIPLLVRQDGIAIAGARLHTSRSRIEVSGNAGELNALKASFQLRGTVSLEEWGPYLGLAIPGGLREQPAWLAARIDLTKGGLRITDGAIRIGESTAELTGTWQDPAKQPAAKTLALHMTVRLDLGDLTRRLRVAAHLQGVARVSGDLRLAGANQYSFLGQLEGSGLALRKGRLRLSGIRIGSGLEAGPHRIAFDRLRIFALGGSFAGRAAISNLARLRADGVLHQVDLRELAGSWGAENVPWDGLLSGPLHIDHTFQDSGLAAGGRLLVTPGAKGEPLSGRVDFDYDSRAGMVRFGGSYLRTPRTSLAFSGALDRQIRAQLVTGNLDDLLPALALLSPGAPRRLPVALQNGVASFNGAVTGKISDPEIAGRIGLTRFVYDRQRFDRLTADVELRRSGLAIRNAFLKQGAMRARVQGWLSLRDWKPYQAGAVSASVSAENGDLTKLASLARISAPVTGTLRIAAQISGTVGDLQGTANVSMENGTIYRQPFERAIAGIVYNSREVRIPSGRLMRGPERVDFSGAFEHPANDFRSGRIQFHIASTPVGLGQLAVVQQHEPGLTGTLQVSADGAAALQPARLSPRILLSALDARVEARGLALRQRPMGDLIATAETKGTALAFQLRSNFANAAIAGGGSWELAGDYPLTADLTFSPIGLSYLETWLTAGPPRVDGVIAGKVNLHGPVMKPEAMKGTLELSRVELNAPPSAASGGAQAIVALHAAQPVVMTLDRSLLRIESARLAGKSADVAITGAVSLREGHTADLRIKGSLGLEFLEIFSPDISSSGAAALDATVQGPIAQPAVNGRMEIQRGSFSIAGLPNSISEAKGTILFTGKQAVIRDLAAETGGGKLTATGFADYGGKELNFRLHAKGDHIRIRYPAGSSTLVNTTLSLSGTSSSSLLSGTATILEINFEPRTDISSLLASSATAAPEISGTGFLAGMQLDIRIQTAPDVQFRSSIAQGVQGDANLHLRGAVARPGMLGRIAITQGQILFLGNKYSIDQGTISFFDPQKIEPTIHFSLQTQVLGIDVTLNLTGPLERLQVTYRSDPPLQFSEIVALLTTGKAPASDPALLAQQPAAQQQGFQQLGISFLGQALASPVSGRLQRLFGLTRFSVSPQLSGVGGGWGPGTVSAAGNNPQALVTLQQAVSSDILFTYIQTVSDTNPQVVRIDWSFSRHWSAILLREQNGQFSVNFQFRQQIK
jgi:translocation and assembly module TamB